MRKLLLAVPTVLLILSACGTSAGPLAPETSSLQPAEDCHEDYRPC